MTPGAKHSRRWALLVTLVVAMVGALAAATSATAGVISPESGGSPNANDISALYEITLYVAIVIFVMVEGILIWSLVRYRSGRGVPEPPQVRGNTPLEIGWTFGAALILVVLTALTFLYLDDIRNPAPSGPDGLSAAKGVKFAAVGQPLPPGGGELDIAVNGQQYLWRYDYPGEKPLFSYYEMVVPINTTVTLDITSQDVAHSWWIPKLGGKADALPGYTNQSWFKISKPGIYEGQCAELCGDNHADMRAVVRALPVDEYEAWAARQAADIEESHRLLAEQREQIEGRQE